MTNKMIITEESRRVTLQQALILKKLKFDFRTNAVWRDGKLPYLEIGKNLLLSQEYTPAPTLHEVLYYLRDIKNLDCYIAMDETLTILKTTDNRNKTSLTTIWESPILDRNQTQSIYLLLIDAALSYLTITERFYRIK